jgi:hypothetical protein
MKQWDAVSHQPRRQIQHRGMYEIQEAGNLSWKKAEGIPKMESKGIC